jgi:putative phosphoribosyl transferase
MKIHADAKPLSQYVQIPIGRIQLDGNLELPPNFRGVVVFAHGSGSSRFSLRNQFVAEELRKHSIGTLLLDLLTPAEEHKYETRFDIDLLATRLESVLDWLRLEPSVASAPIGLFGASTGAAAALKAAAMADGSIGAVVSRGGRPDLAGECLQLVRCPTLLVVGGDDTAVLKMNEDALAKLKCEKQLVIVPHSTHLFEEPGALEEVARLASSWFVRWFGPE